MKDTLFISHATPLDNQFSAWLATKLELFGYKVWVDVNNLKPSVDFWRTIESTLREDVIKYIFVASRSSICEFRDGVQKELAVADRIHRSDDKFIIPVRIDDVQFGDFPVELVRINAIDFKDNWGEGLTELLEHLESQSVIKANETQNSQCAIERWQKTQAAFRSLATDDQDEYSSNLFPIDLPPNVYVYHANELTEKLKARHIPCKINKEIVITFACNKCIRDWLEHDVEFIKIDTQAAINNFTRPCTILGQQITSLSRDVISLINWSLEELFYQHKLCRYRPDSRKRSHSVFYFPYGAKAKRNALSRSKALSGTYKTIRRWHYALNAYYVKYPSAGVIVKWHLVFKDNAGQVLPNSSQITARRSKGKRMFNKELKELLQTAMAFLSNGTEHIYYSACCEENAMSLSSKSLAFISEKSYIEPSMYRNEAIGDE